MPLDSSAKYYWENKKDYKINLLKDIKIFLQRKKKKSENMVVSLKAVWV